MLAPGQGNKELEEQLEILRLFLERMDFKKLRAESERHITEGRRVVFIVYLDNGVPKYEMHIA